MSRCVSKSSHGLAVTLISGPRSSTGDSRRGEFFVLDEQECPTGTCFDDKLSLYRDVFQLSLSVNLLEWDSVHLVQAKLDEA